jgi:hypothetical protein
MCFSAEASFASGAVLSAVGAASMRAVSRPEQRLFASIPFIFALQQFSEGFVWTTLESGSNAHLQEAAAGVFLVTALIVWPVMVPLSVHFMEEVHARKILLSLLLAAGGVVSMFYVYCLLSYDVYPRIDGFHVQYVNAFPVNWAGRVFVLYLASTVLPLFVSSVKRMRLFGALIAAACAISGLFYSQYLTSVWCFFAALISVTVYWILVEARQKTRAAAVEVRY